MRIRKISFTKDTTIHRGEEMKTAIPERKKSEAELQTEEKQSRISKAETARELVAVLDNCPGYIQPDTLSQKLIEFRNDTEKKINAVLAASVNAEESEIDGIAQKIAEILTAQYDERSWEYCFNSKDSALVPNVILPIWERLLQLRTPADMLRNLPVMLAENTVYHNIDIRRKKELNAAITGIRQLLTREMSDDTVKHYTREAFADYIKGKLLELRVDDKFCDNLKKYRGEYMVASFLSHNLQVEEPITSEKITAEIINQKLNQYDIIALKPHYISVSIEINSLLREPVLLENGTLPGRNLYYSEIMRRIEEMQIDDAYMRALQIYCTNRSLFSFEGDVFNFLPRNAMFCRKAIADRKLQRYDRIAAVFAKKEKAEHDLAAEKDALEKELSQLGIFSRKRKNEIRELLEQFPDREKKILSRAQDELKKADAI